MKKSLLTAALVLVASHSLLLAQEAPAPAVNPAAPAPAAGAEGLAKKIGSDCTINFRNDIFATMGGSSLRMTGQLTSVSPEWIVLTTKDAEQWIPRNVVFTIEFSSKPAEGH